MQQFVPGFTPWHITFGTYGTRHHGGDRPTVDKTWNAPGEPFVEPNDARESSSQGRMNFVPVRLSVAQRQFIEMTVPGLAIRGGWTLRACAAQPDHVHVLLDIPSAVHGEKVRRLMKRWLGQALSERWPLAEGASWWAEEGSNKAIKDAAYLNNAYAYVEEQRATVQPGVADGAGDGPARERPVIGLAGGVGSGKSTVAGILRDLGCFVTNSDEQARAALRDPDIKQTLVRWWGDRVIDASTGEIDRSAVASIVFNDPEERRRLETLTHPWIEKRRREEFAAAPPSTKAFVIDAPLLFEAGLDRACDAVIFVGVSEAVRQARVQSTRNWNANELTRRESAQMPLDQKRKRAHHVVQNDGDLPELKRQVSRILEAILTTRQTPPQR